MKYYKVVIPSKEYQKELEKQAETIRSTLKCDKNFAIFSVTTSNNIKVVYLSSLAFEHSTVQK